MTIYAANFDPQDSDFEQFAQQIIELDPRQEKLRGASNQDGDDGLYRNTETGELTTVEAKHLRQYTALPQKYLINIDEAAARNSETYNAPCRRVIVTTSDSLTQGAKAKKRQIQKRNIIEIIDYSCLKKISNAPSTPPDLAQGIKSCLAKKGRRTEGEIKHKRKT